MNFRFNVARPVNSRMLPVRAWKMHIARVRKFSFHRIIDCRNLAAGNKTGGALKYPKLRHFRAQFVNYRHINRKITPRPKFLDFLVGFPSGLFFFPAI